MLIVDNGSRIFATHLLIDKSRFKYGSPWEGYLAHDITMRERRRMCKMLNVDMLLHGEGWGLSATSVAAKGCRVPGLEGVGLAVVTLLGGRDTCLHRDSSPAILHWYPKSMVQLPEHPSPSIVFPSSHASVLAFSPSPQVTLAQMEGCKGLA